MGSRSAALDCAQNRTRVQAGKVGCFLNAGATRDLFNGGRVPGVCEHVPDTRRPDREVGRSVRSTRECFRSTGEQLFARFDRLRDAFRCIRGTVTLIFGTCDLVRDADRDIRRGGDRLRGAISRL